MAVGDMSVQARLIYSVGNINIDLNYLLLPLIVILGIVACIHTNTVYCPAVFTGIFPAFFLGNEVNQGILSFIVKAVERGGGGQEVEEEWGRGGDNEFIDDKEHYYFNY